MANPEIKRTWPETIKHYNKLRGLVYEFLESHYRDVGVKASHITKADARAADAWTLKWEDPKKTPIWRWAEKYTVYNSWKGVKRFDIALSAHGKLCALCYGVPTRKKIVLKLHLLSRDPQKNALSGRVFEIILAAATMYGGLIGSKKIWLVDPLNEGVASYYMKFGFTASYSKDDAATYLHRSI